MPRKIEDIYEISTGLIARTNDGRAYFIKGNGVGSADRWESLPEIPQTDYVPPTDEELESTLTSVQKAFKELFRQFQQAGLVGHHHHGPPHGPGVNKCPIEGCDFESDDVAEMTVHISQKHPS